jgi:hypothetical protein
MLASCKKEGTTADSNVKPEDAAALSKAVKVWHGTRVTGTPPAPTNNANSPVLDWISDHQTIKAVAGRYGIIQPTVVSGSVAGYYIQINGAPDFFKVDYSKPRNIGGRYGTPNAHLPKGLQNHRIFGTDSTGNNLDSAIVISIPSTIQPGTFCATYCAYDDAGNISNLITVCVEVVAFGGDGSASYLSGLWHITGQKDGSSPDWAPVLSTDTTYWSFTCVNNMLSETCPTSNCTFTDYAAYIYADTKADLNFGGDGGLRYDYNYVEKSLDLSTSTCSNPVYTNSGEDEQISGAWSYTATTKKLIIVFDLNSWGIPNPAAYEFMVEKINDNLIYLHDSIDGFSLRLQK